MFTCVLQRHCSIIALESPARTGLKEAFFVTSAGFAVTTATLRYPDASRSRFAAHLQALILVFELLADFVTFTVLPTS